MIMQVSYAKNPIQNEALPHKIQVHLASNGSQRQTTLILIIKSHWRNTTPSHTHIRYFRQRISSGAFWTTRGAIWDVTSAWFHGPGNGAWFRLEKRSRHVDLPYVIWWICEMQLSFRLDQRPGESHLVLEGKKWEAGHLRENQQTP